jgi:predicted SAM-dependent methyltransferase
VSNRKLAKNIIPIVPAGVRAAKLRAEQARINKELADLESPPAPDGKSLKLDLGCSSNKQPGFLGVDRSQRLDKDGKKTVDVVHDLTVFPWPWEDGSVDAVHCSHVLEHIPARKRIGFFNEMHRVLKKGATAQIITPHWNSNRAYGDVTHEWPAVSEMFWFYLDAKWRESNCPHLHGPACPDAKEHEVYSCDFETQWGYTLAPWMANRNDEWKQNALQMYKEAAQDMIATIKKK